MDSNFGIGKIPPFTRALFVLVVALFGVGALVRQVLASTSEDEEYRDIFAVVPGNIQWTFFAVVTAGFFESHLLLFAVNALAFLFCSKYFEQVWGSRELLKFVFVINVLSCVGTCAVLFFEYGATMDDSYIFEHQVNGLAALLSAFVVAFKQTAPEHTLTLFKVFSVRVKHIPSIAMTLMLVPFLLGYIHVMYFLWFFGTLFSWVYIRFYKMQDGIRGDRSETFALASFFPEILHPFIRPISNSTFNLMVAINLCPPLAKTSSDPTDLESGMSKVATKPLPGSDIADAERRRAIALKALDMRLQTPSPSLDGAPSPIINQS